MYREHTTVNGDRQIDVAGKRRRGVGQGDGQTSGNRSPQRTADQRQHRTLDQELANQTEPTGAEGELHRDFLPARRGASEQQARQIGAADEENEQRDGRQETEKREHGHERVAHPAVQTDARRREHVDCGEPLVDLGMFCGHSCPEHAHRGRGLLDGYPWPESAEHFETVRRAIRGESPMRAVDVERHPRIAGEARRRDTPELPAHDANHLAPLAVEDDRLPHDGGRAAELRLPQAFADDDSTATRVIRTQGAAEERHGAQRVEVVGGHEPRGHAHRQGLERQRYLRVPLRDDVREDGVALPDVSDVRPRCRALAGVDANDFVRAAKRQRLQKQRVEDVKVAVPPPINTASVNTAVVADPLFLSSNRTPSSYHAAGRPTRGPEPGALVAVAVLRQCSRRAAEVAEFRRGLRPRFGWGAALGDEIGRAHLEVKCDLIPHVVLDIVSSARHEAEQPSNALRSHTDLTLPLTVGTGAKFHSRREGNIVVSLWPLDAHG